MNSDPAKPKPEEELDEDRTALGKEAIKNAFLDDLFYMQGKFPAPRDQERLLHGARLCGARPHAAALDQHRGRLHRSTARAPSRTFPRNSSWVRISATTSSIWAFSSRVKEGMTELGLNFDELLRRRGGTGPRQRRPRPSGGLLHRFARHARGARARLRHPLRIRHLPSGDHRRLAGREDRQMAALRQSLGTDASRMGG